MNAYKPLIYSKLMINLFNYCYPLNAQTIKWIY